MSEKKIWSYLKAQGFTDAGAAGLMGNMYAESGLRPNNLQNRYEGHLGMTDAEYTEMVDTGSYTNFARDKAGYGLCQWTYWSRKEALLAYAKATGKSIGDLDMQLAFLIKELAGYGLLGALRSATSVREASDLILLKFEKPAGMNTEETQTKRAKYGQGYYDKYATGAKPEKGSGSSMGFSNSPLATVTKISPNRTPNRNHVIDTITIHCYVGQVTVERGLNGFADPDRGASCNYVVGYDGKIGLCVEEKDRSWCTGGYKTVNGVKVPIRVNGISGSSNDYQAVTIEVASDSTHPYAITDKAIVADYITSGVLNADVIRAGAIQDVKKNNYWNLATGEFRLSAYAKVGDSTIASKDDIDDLDDSFNQQKVFNRLTNNGQAQGIYLANKKLYINAEYIATGVLQDSRSNVIFDLNNGKLTIKKGSINIGNNFIVDEDGNLTARRGTFAGTLLAAKGTFGGQLTAATGNFKGVVQAEDFLDRYGNSMMSGVKFKSDYLDLYGITVTNKHTGAVTFKVDGSSGEVTINGKVTMGAGSSINWATVTNVNLGYNPAYTLASSANTKANQAQSDAADAHDEASAAWSRANQAYYDRCTDENVFNILTSGGTKFGIFSDSTYGRLYINANYITPIC